MDSPPVRASNLFSSNSVVTLGVLTVVVKGRCLIEVSRGRVGLIRCYLQYMHASRNPQSAFRLQARKIWLAGAGASRDCALVVVLRAFSDMVVTFRDRRKGDRSGFTSKCRFRGRGSTLDMVEIFNGL